MAKRSLQICKVCRKTMYVTAECPKRDNAPVCYYCCRKCKDCEPVEKRAFEM